MAERAKFPRYIEAAFVAALRDNPVVLIQGPRQCGKTTLAKMVGERRGHAYYTFDDAETLKFARFDPMGFLASLPKRVILDEVQHIPELFAPLKAMVDADDNPGKVILTGSANVLLVPKLSDSLAGRMEILRLHPFSECEVGGSDNRILDRLFGTKFKMERYRRLGAELPKRIAAGGFPRAKARAAGDDSGKWYLSYLDAMVQRDAKDMGKIRSLEALPKLMAAAATQTAHLFNISELAGPMELSRPTIREYATILERLFLLDIIPPWHNNKLNRLIKTPKLHLGDAGFATALLGRNAKGLEDDRTLLGQVLETFVLQELKRQASWHADRIAFHHYRDKDGNEVDIVLERGDGTCAGVEVKAANVVDRTDYKGLKVLRDAVGSKFTCGIVLYDGEAIHRVDESLFAVPISALWEKPR